MNHERFELLFLSDRSLSPAEADLLRRHLADCPNCTETRARWDSVRTVLNSVEMVGAPTGFKGRLAARHTSEAVGRGRRQAWRLFAATSIGATALSVALVLMLMQSRSFLPMAFAGVLQQALRLWLWIRAAGEVASAFASTVPTPVAAAAVIGGVGLIAAVGLVATLGTFGIIRFSFQGVRS